MAENGLTPTMTKLVFHNDAIKKFDTSVIEMGCAMGLLCKKEDNFQWFHKSAQEFCCGFFFANDPDKLNSYLVGVKSMKDALSISLVLVFAARSKKAAEIILKKLIEIFSSSDIQSQVSDYYSGKLSYDEMRPIQQFIELCLECNFEADTKSELIPIITGLFPHGKVVFHGITSKTAISLAYYMEHCNSDAICDITLSPVAHASDPFIFYGPIYRMYANTLQGTKAIPDDQIQKLVTKFKAAHPDLHENWEQYNPSQLAARIASIQACEGLPSSSETDIVPIVHNFSHVKLQSLNVDYFKLGVNFDHILNSLDSDHLQSLLQLSVRSTGLIPEQITRLGERLHKMPLLRVLEISRNKAEASQSGMPSLARNLKECSELRELDVSDMNASAEDMEILAENLPPQVTWLAIDRNNMNDSVATYLIENLPKNMTHLYISMWYLSEAAHNTLLSAIRNTLHKTLRELMVKSSPYGEALVRHARLVLTTCNYLEWIRLDSTGKDLVPKDCMQEFIQAIQQTTNLKVLWLEGIILEKETFERLVEMCKRKFVRELR